MRPTKPGCSTSPIRIAIAHVTLDDVAPAIAHRHDLGAVLPADRGRLSLVLGPLATHVVALLTETLRVIVNDGHLTLVLDDDATLGRGDGGTFADGLCRLRQRRRRRGCRRPCLTEVRTHLEVLKVELALGRCRWRRRRGRSCGFGRRRQQIEDRRRRDSLNRRR
jgi:hypothetical protein